MAEGEPLMSALVAKARRLDTLADEPLPVVRRPGQTGRTALLSLDLVRKALPRSLVVAAGLDPTRTTGEVPPILWDDGTSRLLVHLDKATVVTGDGTIDVTVEVECDQAGRVAVVCTFVTSGRARPAGFSWATETRPRGPAVVVENWGDALVALCWRALIEIARGGAAAQGTDDVGQPLVPSTVVAIPEGLVVVPMAAPRFMRTVRSLP